MRLVLHRVGWRRTGALLARVAAVCIGGCAHPCPAALLVGVLVAQEGELVAIPDGEGPATRIKWPSGHAVRREGDALAVTDFLGKVVAREGDTVRLGGGETSQSDKSWTMCGLVEVV